MKGLNTKYILCLVSILVVSFFAVSVQAKISEEFRNDIEATYVPAIPHRGLITAEAPLEMDKLKTFIVVEKDRAIPAERAFYFIAPSDYDYRGSEIKDGYLKTRIGKPYTHLPKGTVMAVAGVVYSGRNIFIKLISLEKMPPQYDKKLKPTRVTCMVGKKFNKSIFKNMDTVSVTNTFNEWFVPFQSLLEARKYSNTIAPPVVDTFFE